jgi:hypothetical protein
VYVVSIAASRDRGYRIIPPLVMGASLGALVSAPSWLNFVQVIVTDEAGAFVHWSPNFFSLGQLISFAFSILARRHQ